MHNHIKVALRSALLAVACVPAMAVAADFNGAWARDAARSKPAPYPNYWITRSPPPAPNSNNVFLMVVQQSAERLLIVHPVHPVRTYMLDGKGHTTPTDSGLAKVTTTAAVTGETLSIATVQPYGGMPGNVTMKANETWSLSADGKELTISTVRELPAERQTFTEVYTRK